MAYPPAVPPSTRSDSTPQATNHPGDHNGLSRALTDIINELGTNPSGPQGSVQARITAVESAKANLAGATFTGPVRINSTGDASLPSTGHGFQIGLNNGLNVAFDTNEIQARSNGVKSNLGLNMDGGDVTVGGVIRAPSGVDVGGKVNLNEDGSASFDQSVTANGLTSTSTIRSGDDPTGSNKNGAQLSTLGLIRAASNNTSPTVWLKKWGTGVGAGEKFIQFLRTDAENDVGSIAIVSSSSIVYDTTSDYRLKDHLGAITDACARVQALGVLAFRGRWIGDPAEAHTWDMLNAHDIAAVAPYAVRGEKDAVEPSGKLIPQQVDYGTLVPLLVAAVAELIERVLTLEAR